MQGSQGRVIEVAAPVVGDGHLAIIGAVAGPVTVEMVIDPVPAMWVLTARQPALPLNSNPSGSRCSKSNI